MTSKSKTSKSKKRVSSASFSPTEILNLLRARKERPVTFTEIVQALEVPSGERIELRRTLRQLIAAKKVLRLDRRHYGLAAQKEGVITGKIQLHRDGYGFLIPEDSRFPDIFLSPKEVSGLMHRDKVSLQPAKKERGRRREPRTLQVVERAHKRIVGRYEVGGKYDFVFPDDPRLLQEIRIPKKAGKGARPNQIVLAEITRFPTRQEGPEGRILRILGDADDPHIDSLIVIHKYDLPETFSSQAEEETAALSQELSLRDLAPRQDLRRLNFFTIDGENARDFDDAVAIAPQGKGWNLWVSIADVSHYVREGSVLDQEALSRGTSVYFPEKALPMLPAPISNGICSLNPEEDRLTLTVEMQFDPRGQILGFQVYPSVIHSRARLTYTLVKQMLEEEQPELIARFPSVYRDLQNMAALGRTLRSRRMERGSIDFDLPEPEVILDVQGKIEEIVRAERHIGHRIIEEFMISANEAVAQFLSTRDLPAIYRVHEPPELEKVEILQEFVAHLGYRWTPRGKLKPGLFGRLLEQVQGRPEEKSVNHLLLRTMKQARYLEKNLEHFALASPHYLHFTSPIRRYPDLIVHRILQEVFLSGNLPEKRRHHWEKNLPFLAEHCSQRERLAMEAEREIIERKKVQFMRGKIGQEFNGYISGVMPFGIFVELEDFFIEGMVHLTRLPEDQYEYWENRHTLAGKSTKKFFRLGDRVRVRVDSASLERRQIDFSLIQ